MAEGRVSSLAHHQNMLNNALRVQTNIYNKQNQISTGRKADQFVGLGIGQSERLVGLEDKLARIDNFLAVNSQAQATMETVDEAMSAMIELTSQAQQLLMQRRSDASSGSLNFETQMNSIFQSFAILMNTTENGRYLFSGTRTDSQAIDPALGIPLPVTDGELDAGYYTGSTQSVTVRIEDGVELPLGLRGDHEAFQTIFSAMSLAVRGYEGTVNDVSLRDATDLMQQGMDRLITARAELGTNTAISVRTSEQQTSIKVYYKQLQEDLIASDIVGLSADLALDQTILQATFQTFARINQLRLTDYLS